VLFPSILYLQNHLEVRITPYIHDTMLRPSIICIRRYYILHWNFLMIHILIITYQNPVIVIISWLFFVFTSSVLWHHTHDQFYLLQRLCFSYKDAEDWMEQQVILILHFYLLQHPLFNYKFLMMLALIFFCSRGMSTAHAIFITIMSVYLVFLSGLFCDQLDGPVTFRSSHLSNFTLGVCYYFVVMWK